MVLSNYQQSEVKDPPPLTPPTFFVVIQTTGEEWS